MRGPTGRKAGCALCLNWRVSSAAPFGSPLHVGQPNIGNRDRFLELTAQALDRRWLTNDGPLVRDLEARIALYLGVKHCVAVVNGTVALEIGIRALGMSGEVIVPSYTFVATAHALRWLGLVPVFADIDPTTHALDPAAVRRAITPATTGIIGVHLWGRPAPVLELESVAREHDLALMFDAAHAFGVSSGGRMVGSFGDAEIFSFHATKFFNSIEGGAITTDDDEVARRARLMRNFGFVAEDTVVSDGTNGKMSEISAAMGIANLEVVDDIIRVNRRNHALYTRESEDIPGVTVLPIADDERSNYQYVVLMVDESCAVGRDEIIGRLRENNVLARRYFWPGCHRMEPYRTLDPRASERLPETERVADRVVVLPTGMNVDEDSIRRVMSIVRESVVGA